jgi:hypothetical protein
VALLQQEVADAVLAVVQERVDLLAPLPVRQHAADRVGIAERSRPRGGGRDETLAHPEDADVGGGVPRGVHEVG